MKLTVLLLAAALLLVLASCGKDSGEANHYTRYDNLIDGSKPVAYGEDRDVFIFAGARNQAQVASILDSTLSREVTLTVPERYFNPVSIDFKEFDTYLNYKNLVFCGTLDGADEVSAQMLRTLAPNLIDSAKESGAELFVINNQHVRDQLILYLLAADAPSLESLARQRADQIFGYFRERYEKRLGYQAYRLSVYAASFFEDWPFTLQVPVNFRPFREDKAGGFLSFIYQPATPSRSIPDKYVSVHHQAMAENTIDADWLYAKRQELGARYYNGDEIYKYQAEEARIAGQDGLRIYGHWINKSLGGGVGGAFQTYAFWHEISQTAYVVDSIVYFPDGEKLPSLLELGMISQSLQIK
ncbi:MAG: DUF4837 family protein [Candidatus Syntrophosphaera sp.]|nr:DUF4837 family protein [Candidatus Syntrophosphaera sp.]